MLLKRPGPYLLKTGIIDTPGVRSLIKAAVKTHPTRLAGSSGRTIIKSVSAKQRPRRPRG
jgi:hypothetical protein